MQSAILNIVKIRECKTSPCLIHSLLASPLLMLLSSAKKIGVQFSSRGKSFECKKEIWSAYLYSAHSLHTLHFSRHRLSVSHTALVAAAEYLSFEMQYPKKARQKKAWRHLPLSRSQEKNEMEKVTGNLILFSRCSVAQKELSFWDFSAHYKYI